jgi:lipopolysaccharide transport system permease protein
MAPVNCLGKLVFCLEFRYPPGTVLVQHSYSHSTSPLEVFSSFWRNRELIWQLTRREIAARYKGSVLGLLWSFVNPVLMLAVYTFVFSVAFRARWGTGGDGKAEYAVVLFAGMIVYGLFSECVTRAPGLILANVNYVKKVFFPLEILIWVVTGSALFHAGISLIVLLLFNGIIAASVHWTALLLPLVVLPLIFFTLGLVWILASAGVFLRDIGQTVGIATTALLFLSPVLYPATMLPEKYRLLILLNPLTFIIDQARGVLLWGRFPDWATLGAYLLGGWIVSCLGFFWFQRTRNGFADVL